MTEFLSKDPTQALDEVKEKLYDRFLHIRDKLNEPTQGFTNHGIKKQCEDEEKFLLKLLDIIERS